MDENKNYQNNEELETEEQAQDVAEEIQDTPDAQSGEALEEAQDVQADETAEVQDEAEEQAPVLVSAPKKSILPVVLITVCATVLVAVLIALAVNFLPRVFNKYNRMGYVDISGKTIADIAEENGMTVEEFLEMYELPENMPANTTEAAAYYNIPTKMIAQMYGMDLETFKTTLNMPQEVTEDTPWGEAEGLLSLKDYVGEANVESFKAQYELGDEITGDTRWAEIRNVVDNAQKKQREEAEKAAEEAAKKTESDAEEETPTEGDDEQTPAEGDVAAAGEPEQVTE